MGIENYELVTKVNIPLSDEGILLYCKCEDYSEFKEHFMYLMKLLVRKGIFTNSRDQIDIKSEDVHKFKNKILHIMRYFDFMYLNYEHVVMMNKLLNLVKDKLNQFGKSVQFGKFKQKYYMRKFFPEGKCQHEYYCKVNQMMIKCPYKTKHETAYCHNHSQRYGDEITKQTGIIEDIAMIILTF